MSELLRKYVHNGIIEAEIDELLSKYLQEDIYAGVTVKHHTNPMKFVIKVLNPVETIGPERSRLLLIQSLISQRLDVPMSDVEIVFEKIADKGLEPAYHAEQLRQAFLNNKPYKRVINNIIRSSKLAGAQGVMIRVAGKLKGQRAKGVKYFDGLLIQSGQSAKDYIKTVMSEAKCKQGVMGIQVKIMLPFDAEGIKGPNTMMSDKIIIRDPSTFN